VAEILLADRRFARVVTTTTRAPRGDETDGVDYHFLTDAAFRDAIEAGEFLEHAAVHEHWYGTPRAGVDAIVKTGRHALLLIDVKGAAQVRDAGIPALFIFLTPPSLQELERRLRARGTEDEARIRGRMDVAKREMLRADDYDHVVVNDRRDAAAARVKDIVLRAA
jgi:guanylate kinase